MAKPTHNSWTLGGLSLPELLRRTVRESWQDEVFGQAGRMAFYHFFAIFPSLLLFFAIAFRIPHLGSHLKSALEDMSRQVLPSQVSQLFQTMIDELSGHAPSGAHFIPVLAGAAWAGLNATWAMVYGLNNAYEVEEKRPKQKLAVLIVGLALALACAVFAALTLILCSRSLEGHFHGSMLALRAAEWTILSLFLIFWFSVLYRFAPNLADARWQLSTPGAVCALILWTAATLGTRLYFGHINNYSLSYGHLNAVAMLLLWLYVSNGAILIGGEMNSEIEKSAAGSTGPGERTGNRKRHS